MSFAKWRRKMLQLPGAAERVAKIKTELRAAIAAAKTAGKVRR